MEDENKDYIDLERIASESLGLDNKLRRYWKRLVRESLKIAKERGLDIGVINQDSTSSYDIIVVKHGEEVNAYDLLRLSKDMFPSLSRRYNQGLEKHYRLHKKLKSLLAKVDKDCY